MTADLASLAHSTDAETAPAHVTLVRPTMVGSGGAWVSSLTPPLGVAYLAAVLRKNEIPVAIIDALAEAPTQIVEESGYLLQGLTIEQTVARIDPNTDIVAISCMFTQDWPWTRRLIRAVREALPDVLIVTGGEHITALTEYSLRDRPEIDICVLGEGEETLIDIVAKCRDRAALAEVPGTAFLAEGEVVKTGPRQRIRAIDALPYPAWDLLPIETYLDTRNGFGVYRGRSMGILATRGCPYRCTFCSNPQMYGTVYVMRDPDDVLDELQLYMDKYQAENFDFFDLTMVVKKKWILEFCEGIERRGMNFTWQLPGGTRSEVIDDEVAAALYRTGCRNVTYAPESGSVETLKLIKKQVKLPRLKSSIRAALRQGIIVKTHVIFGFPHERRRHLMATLWFCWKLAVIGVHDLACFMFSPYPGTEMFDDLRARNKIGNLDGDYFRSLAGNRNLLSSIDYCDHVGAFELGLWRGFGMISFFALSFLIRPWRFFRLIRNVFKNEGETSLEHRLNALLRRRATRATATPAMVELQRDRVGRVAS